MSDTEPEMSKVPFNCHACGADFQLHHDGVTAQDIDVICRCGARNHWTFQPRPNRRWGIGFAADDSVFGAPLPSELRMRS